MKLRKLIFLLLPLCLYSCSNEEDIPGSPPLADAGEDLTLPIDQAGTISLSAAASSDPDGDSLSYLWELLSQPDGSTANINNANELTASITPDMEGTYEIQLNVDDGNHPPVQDMLTITITEAVNEAPVANAGPDKSGQLNTTVTLDGSQSSDPNNDALNYQWTLSSKPVGSEVSITDADKPMASFVPDKIGNYSFRLKVTDPIGASDSDNVDITIN